MSTSSFSLKTSGDEFDKYMPKLLNFCDKDKQDLEFELKTDEDIYTVNPGKIFIFNSKNENIGSGRTLYNFELKGNPFKVLNFNSKINPDKNPYKFTSIQFLGCNEYAKNILEAYPEEFLQLAPTETKKYTPYIDEDGEELYEVELESHTIKTNLGGNKKRKSKKKSSKKKLSKKKSSKKKSLKIKKKTSKYL
jgi:hypothetical protein